MRLRGCCWWRTSARRRSSRRLHAAQALAVVPTPRDTARVIMERIEQRVLDYYHTQLIRRGAAQLSFEEFLEGYRLCVIQRALKVIGRFAYLEREGKSGYEVYIPH